MSIAQLHRVPPTPRRPLLALTGFLAVLWAIGCGASSDGAGDDAATAGTPGSTGSGASSPGPGGDGSGTGALAGFGGSGGTSLGGSVGVGGVVGGGGTNPDPGSGGPYWQSGAWAGSVWTEVGGVGSNITAPSAEAPYCASGTLAADSTWASVAMVGFNLAQARGESAPLGAVVPTKDGVRVEVSNPGGSQLRVQVEGPDGRTDGNQRWCAAVEGGGGFIPWSAFNTKCWDGSGAAYRGEQLVTLSVLVPSSNTDAIPFNYCVKLVTEEGGGAGGSGSGGSGSGGSGSGGSGSGGSSGGGTNPVDFYGQLDCKGGRLKGSKTGAIAQVRGMSFFWSNWSAGLWREDMVDRVFNELKGEIIRLPMGVKDDGSPYSWGDEALVSKLVDKAIAKGVYVLIDWHSHGANQNVGAAKDFFGRMAAKYGKHDHVMFELFNEPINQSWGEVKAYAEQVIPVIRQHSDNLIVVGTPKWSQDVDKAADNPITSTGNVAYTLHFYAKSHGGWLRDKARSALSRGHCLFVTEWGTTHADGGQWANGNAGVDYGSTKEWLGFMDEFNLSWANWSVMNKEESSSLFNPGTENLSENGNYLKEILTGYVASNPWR